MNNIFYEAFFSAFMLITLMFVLGSNGHASTLNPCEYMNLYADQAAKLDTGNDPNFERIKQQNNQEMVRSCQEYEIARTRQDTNNIGVERSGNGS